MNKRRFIFLIKGLILPIILISLFFSYYNNTNTTQEYGTEKYRGPAEFKKYFSAIKRGENPDSPIQYRSGYKELELKKMQENISKRAFLRSSTNQKDEDSPTFGSSAAATATFTERGPNNVPGRTRAIVVDAADASGNTWYAGAVGGGVWKTTNSGVNWTSLSEDMENIAISSIAQSANNPSILYAGTGESWVGNIDAIDGSGIFKSIDGGANWTNISKKSGSIIDEKFFQVSRVVADPSNANVVVISTMSSSGITYIFKSTDGGLNWMEAKQGIKPIQQVVASPSSFDTLYAAVNSSNVLKSVDAGSTWTDVTGFGSATGTYTRVEIAVAHSTANIVYAAIVGNNISFLYVSFDGGISWTEAKNNDGSKDGWLNIQGWYDNCITVNPYNDSIVYVGGIDTYKFTLDGKNWNLGLMNKDGIHITDGYNDIDSLNTNVHVDHHFLGTIKDGGGKFRILHGNDGGVAVSKSSINPGETDGDFTLADSGYNTSQAYGADKVKEAHQYISGFQDNGTWLSPKGENASSSSDYTYKIGGDGFEVITHWNNSDSMMGGYQNNGLWRSMDGGNVWYFVATNEMRNNGPFITRISTSYQDPDVVYAVSGLGAHKSKNFGGSWKTVSMDSGWSFWSGSDIEVSQANPRFVWAGGEMSSVGNIFVSKDWGESFTAVPDFANIGKISGLYSHPTEDSTAYILFSSFGRAKIIETKDLGATWTDISGFPANNVAGLSSNGFPNVPVYSLAVMPFDSDVIWAGTDIGLVESTDRGTTWNLVNSNLPYVSIWDMKIKDQGEIVLATHGRGVWTATIPALTSFVPKTVILQPELVSYNQPGSEFKVDIRIKLKSVFDSIQFKTDNTLLHTFYDADTLGMDTINVTFSAAGTYPVIATGYKNGIAYSSNTMNIIVALTLAIAETFGTDFSGLSGDEFTLNGFKIGTVGGFSTGEILHSYPNPYQNAGSGGEIHLIATLNSPLIISNYTPSIKFREVAIVEIGEPGSYYGSAEFWDYVIVEASKHKEDNWKALIDGYDSNTHSDWLVAYNSEISATSTMLKSREIQFTPKFSVGDTVKLRFRLFSDPFTVGWGWAIDDLYIQMDPPVVSGIEDPQEDIGINIYPNPSDGIFNVKFNNVWKGNIDIKVLDIFGRNQHQNILDNSSGNETHKINLSNNSNGLYILELNQDGKRVVKKIIKK